MSKSMQILEEVKTVTLSMGHGFTAISMTRTEILLLSSAI